MATLKTNTLTGTSTAGSIAVTGEGNSTTTNLQQGLVKMWIRLDGTASGAAEHDSFNVTSTADNGTGDHTINIANDFSSINYCAVGSTLGTTTGNFATTVMGHQQAYTAGAITFEVRNTVDDSLYDQNSVNVSAHGDLA